MALGLLWAVLAALATNMLLGMAWYGFLFQDTWMEAMGYDELSEEDSQRMQAEARPGYLVSMVGAALATVLLWFLYGWADGMPVEGWVKGFELGFMAWLGFYVGPTLTSTFFGEGNQKAWAIGAGYWGLCSVLYGVYVGLFF